MDDYRNYVREVYGEGRKKRNFLYLLLIIIGLILLFSFLGSNQNTPAVNRCEGFEYFKFVNQRLVNNRYSVQIENGGKEAELFSLTVDGMGDIRDIVILKPGEETTIYTEDININKLKGEVYSFRVEIGYNFIGEDNKRKETIMCSANVY